MADTRKSKRTTPPKAVKKPPRSKKPAAKRTKSEAAAVRPKDLHLGLPSSRQLVIQTWRMFKGHWRLLISIVAVYLLLNVLFASGLSNLSSAVSNIQSNFRDTTAGTQSFAKALSGFGLLVGTAGSSGSAAASLLQSGLFVIESLVIIWALRQLTAAKNITVKEAYYHSSYPLIPFMLVLLVIFIQLLPITFGAIIVNAVLTTAVASLAWLTWLAWLIFIALAGWSFYMVSSSIFAVYIVTLPEVQPREALRAAKNLVNFRRRVIIPKIIFLPVFILLIMAAVIIPLIILAPAVVAPVFYVLGMLSILFVHTYLYSLYRSLLG